MINEQENEAPRLLEGKLLDVNGRHGTTEVELRAKGKKSRWKTTLYVHHGEPQVFEGELDVEHDEDHIAMKCRHNVSADHGVDVEIDLVAEKCANPAFLGKYRVGDMRGRFPLTAGVMILWIAR